MPWDENPTADEGAEDTTPTDVEVAGQEGVKVVSCGNGVGCNIGS